MGEIRYIDDEYDVTLVVHKASVQDGIERVVLHDLEVDKLSTESDPGDTPGELIRRAMTQLTRVRHYPDSVTATSEIVNNDPTKPRRIDLPLTVEDYMALPEALTELWLNETYRLNPHWTGRASGKNPSEPSAETGSTANSALGSKRKRNAKKAQ